VKHHKFTQPGGIAQMIRTDPREMAQADAALKSMQATLPKVPPHAHVYEQGKCKRCGRPEPEQAS
jgi:hypothetical protein